MTAALVAFGDVQPSGRFSDRRPSSPPKELSGCKRDPADPAWGIVCSTLGSKQRRPVETQANQVDREWVQEPVQQLPVADSGAQYVLAHAMIKERPARSKRAFKDVVVG